MRVIALTTLCALFHLGIAAAPNIRLRLTDKIAEELGNILAPETYDRIATIDDRLFQLSGNPRFQLRRSSARPSILFEPPSVVRIKVNESDALMVRTHQMYGPDGLDEGVVKTDIRDSSLELVFRLFKTAKNVPMAEFLFCFYDPGRTATTVYNFNDPTDWTRRYMAAEDEKMAAMGYTLCPMLKQSLLLVEKMDIELNNLAVINPETLLDMSLTSDPLVTNHAVQMDFRGEILAVDGRGRITREQAEPALVDDGDESRMATAFISDAFVNEFLKTMLFAGPQESMDFSLRNREDQEKPIYDAIYRTFAQVQQRANVDLGLNSSVDYFGVDMKEASVEFQESNGGRIVATALAAISVYNYDHGWNPEVPASTPAVINVRGTLAFSGEIALPEGHRLPRVIARVEVLEAELVSAENVVDKTQRDTLPVAPILEFDQDVHMGLKERAGGPATNLLDFATGALNRVIQVAEEFQFDLDQQVPESERKLYTFDDQAYHVVPPEIRGLTGFPTGPQQVLLEVVKVTSVDVSVRDHTLSAGLSLGIDIDRLVHAMQQMKLMGREMAMRYRCENPPCDMPAEEDPFEDIP